MIETWHDTKENKTYEWPQIITNPEEYKAQRIIGWLRQKESEFNGRSHHWERESGGGHNAYEKHQIGVAGEIPFLKMLKGELSINKWERDCVNRYNAISSRDREQTYRSDIESIVHGPIQIKSTTRYPGSNAPHLNLVLKDLVPGTLFILMGVSKYGYKTHIYGSTFNLNVEHEDFLKKARTKYENNKKDPPISSIHFKYLTPFEPYYEGNIGPQLLSWTNRRIEEDLRLGVLTAEDLERLALALKYSDIDYPSQKVFTDRFFIGLQGGSPP